MIRNKKKRYILNLLSLLLIMQCITWCTIMTRAEGLDEKIPQPFNIKLSENLTVEFELDSHNAIENINVVEITMIAGDYSCKEVFDTIEWNENTGKVDVYDLVSGELAMLSDGKGIVSVKVRVGSSTYDLWSDQSEMSNSVECNFKVLPDPMNARLTSDLIAEFEVLVDKPQDKVKDAKIYLYFDSISVATFVVEDITWVQNTGKINLSEYIQKYCDENMNEGTEIKYHIQISGKNGYLSCIGGTTSNILSYKENNSILPSPKYCRLSEDLIVEFECDIENPNDNIGNVGIIVYFPNENISTYVYNGFEWNGQVGRYDLKEFVDKTVIEKYSGRTTLYCILSYSLKDDFKSKSQSVMSNTVEYSVNSSVLPKPRNIKLSDKLIVEFGIDVDNPEEKVEDAQVAFWLEDLEKWYGFSHVKIKWDGNNGMIRMGNQFIEAMKRLRGDSYDGMSVVSVKVKLNGKEGYVESDYSEESELITFEGKVRIEEIELPRKIYFIQAGREGAISVKVKPETVEHDNLEWLSDNSDILEVDSNGNIKAKTIGRTNIHVRVEDLEETINVVIYGMTCNIEDKTSNKNMLNLCQGIIELGCDQSVSSHYNFRKENGSFKEIRNDVIAAAENGSIIHVDYKLKDLDINEYSECIKELQEALGNVNANPVVIKGIAIELYYMDKSGCKQDVGEITGKLENPIIVPVALPNEDHETIGIRYNLLIDEMGPNGHLFTTNNIEYYKDCSVKVKTDGFYNLIWMKEQNYNTSTDILGGVNINEENFPDAEFRRYVQSLDINGDGYLSAPEIDAVTYFCVGMAAINGEERCIGGGIIKNLKGIEYFRKLKKFECYGNKLTALDLSKNIELEELDCRGNQLSDLNLSANTALIKLACDMNPLESLNVSNNTKLIGLTCEQTNLKELDIRQCPALMMVLHKGDKSIIEGIVRSTGRKTVGIEYTYTDESSFKFLYIDSQIKLIDGTVMTVFNDIAESDWWYEAVQYVYDNEIMSGTKGGFEPKQSIPREQFVQILYNHSGKPSVAGIVNKFPDVKNQWYKDAVLWANTHDIVNGYDNGLFGVGDNITREQIAVVLYKYAKNNGYDLTKTNDYIDQFSDNVKVDSWAREAMDWLTTQGIMSGKGTSTDKADLRLDPLGNATRAECATMIMKLLTKNGVVKE